MLELLLAGLSTRSYGKAVGRMAETAGVSKSSVSRQAAGERLKELAERRLDDRNYLIIYVDGIPVRRPPCARGARRGRQGQQADPGPPGGRERERRRCAGAA